MRNILWLFVGSLLSVNSFGAERSAISDANEQHFRMLLSQYEEACKASSSSTQSPTRQRVDSKSDGLKERTARFEGLPFMGLAASSSTSTLSSSASHIQQDFRKNASVTSPRLRPAEDEEVFQMDPIAHEYPQKDSDNEDEVKKDPVKELVSAVPIDIASDMPDVPKLVELIDLTQDWGINLANVKLRQKLLRERHLINQETVSVAISNIRSLKSRLNTILTELAMSVHNQRKIKKALNPEEDQEQSTQKKKHGTKEKKESKQEQKDKKEHLEQSLKVVNDKIDRCFMPGFNNPLDIPGFIQELEIHLLERLGLYGLTIDHLRNLPPMPYEPSTVVDDTNK
jgi:hypothetical protein